MLSFSQLPALSPTPGLPPAFTGTHYMQGGGWCDREEVVKYKSRGIQLLWALVSPSVKRGIELEKPRSKAPPVLTF